MCSFVFFFLAVLLFAPWRVIGTWNGGLLELRLRFLGVTFVLWNRDVFERPEPDLKIHHDRRLRESGVLIDEFVGRIQAIIDHQDALVQSGRLLLRLARQFRGWWHLENSRIEFTIGLQNPAHTGMALGALSASGGMVEARWAKLRISGRADFDSLTFQSRGEVIFRIRAWDPIWDLTQAMIAAPWRSLLKFKRALVYP
jgi:hypothetical protein